MGYGEFMGNASIHWRVLHEEYEDSSAPPAPQAPTGGRKRTAAAAAAATIKMPQGDNQQRRIARARLRTADVPPDVRATHIDNLDVLDFEARGKDTITLDQVGRCCDTKDHKGHFRVQMRFRDRRQARAALARATLNISRDGVVIVDVPVINRTEEEVGPPANPPAEVRVDW